MVTLVPCAISSPPTKSSNDGPCSSFRANADAAGRAAVVAVAAVAAAAVASVLVRMCESGVIVVWGRTVDMKRRHQLDRLIKRQLD